MEIKRYLIWIFIILFTACGSPKAMVKAPAESPDESEIVIVDSDSLSMILKQIRMATAKAEAHWLLADTTATEKALDDAIEIIQNLTEAELTELADDTLYQRLNRDINRIQDGLSTGDITDNDSEADDVRRALLDLQEDVAVDTSTIETMTDEGKYSIPVIMNRKVQNTIKYFTQGRGRRVYEVWLTRGARYEAMIRRILREEGVPEDLYYLGMIESGFNPRARSWARAVGPWQFIKSTGKYYGLHASYWADDRRDVENATRAAAKHLKDLYKRFGDWYLAMAGYNCNPARIARRVRIQKTTDYFKLRYLPRETRGYVPNFLAAMIIGKNLEAYGFEKPTDVKPLVYDRIWIKDAVDISHIATAADTSYQAIREMNPALTKWLTPSDRDSMYLNVPVGTGEKVLSYLNTLPESQKRKYIRYRVRPGDAMSLLSDRFGIRMSEIRRINKKRSNTLVAGRTLLIPVPVSKYHFAKSRYAPKPKATVKKFPRKPVNTANLEKVTYTVKAGNTLGEIAEIYDTHAKHIRRWNGLSFRQSLRVGQQLTLWVPKGFKPILDWQKKYQPDFDKYDYHKVRRGDTLWTIAQKYDISIDRLKSLNKMTGNAVKVGDYIKLGPKSSSQPN